MQFYSGFSLSNDAVLFESFLKSTEFTLAGFSYGATKAFEEALRSKKRVDTLQLFSPAFFQDKDEKFKRMQMMYFNKDQATYLKNFMASCFSPFTKPEEVKLEEGTALELETLLNYVWDEEKLMALVEKGVEIEVYLGTQDKIIDSHQAREFFTPYASVYFINHAGHSLQTKGE